MQRVNFSHRATILAAMVGALGCSVGVAPDADLGFATGSAMGDASSTMTDLNTGTGTGATHQEGGEHEGSGDSVGEGGETTGSTLGCADGMVNQQETDIDCGGPQCGPCDLERICKLPRDCRSNFCWQGRCRQPSCMDGIQNQGEQGVDCGGPCTAACNEDECSADEDCGDGTCQSGMCQGATCSDGKRNGDETDIDCGGACPPCAVGDDCASGSDCTSDLCHQGHCVSGECLVDDDCRDLDRECRRGVCNLESRLCETEPAHEGESCGTAQACRDGRVCAQGVCADGIPRDCSHLDDACSRGRCDPGRDACVASSLVTFYDDFDLPSNQMTKWTVDSNSSSWQFGAARKGVSCSGVFDPEFDHTPTADNAIMGAILGGCPDSGHLDGDCLMGPIIDTRAIGVQDELTFWRWLDSPGLPDVEDTIWMTDPATGDWQPVVEPFDGPVRDDAWTRVQLPLAGREMQRFQFAICFEVSSTLAPNMAGWNIDDVAIAPPGCEPWSAAGNLVEQTMARALRGDARGL